MFVPLETPRLILRLFTSEDAPAMFDYASDPHTTRYVGWPRHDSIEETLETIGRFSSQAAAGTDFSLAIVRKEDGQLLGGTGIHKVKVGLGSTGWILRRNARGQGYGAEAVMHVIEAAFKEWPDLKKIEATVHPDNIASWKLAERVGMSRLKWQMEPLDMPNLDDDEHLLYVYRIERPA